MVHVTSKMVAAGGPATTHRSEYPDVDAALIVIDEVIVRRAVEIPAAARLQPTTIANDVASHQIS